MQIVNALIHIFPTPTHQERKEVYRVCRSFKRSRENMSRVSGRQYNSDGERHGWYLSRGIVYCCECQQLGRAYQGRNIEAHAKAAAAQKGFFSLFVGHDS
jgi:hypothetical protein